MSWLESQDMRVLERFLDVSSMRQTLVSTNIANVDTPGYHTRDVDFHGELSRAMNSDSPDQMSPFVMPVRGLLARPDGNNVNPEREALLLAQVQLQFKAATSILKAQFAELNTAIKEGGQ